MKNTRCKPGDLAVVIYDIPGCIKNVGRLVRVRGPLALNCVYQLHCWLIQPVSPEPWYIDYYWEVRRCKDVSKRKLEHPDQWLMPVRPQRRDIKDGRVVVALPCDHQPPETIALTITSALPTPT